VEKVARRRRRQSNKIKPENAKNTVIGRTCGAREAGVVRVDLTLSVPQMFRLQPLNQLV
jgi:hypothetical protein